MSEQLPPTRDVDLPRSEVQDGEINLLQYMLVLAKHKWMIFWTATLALILSCGISLLLPDIFTATARILPPSDTKGSLSSMLGGVSDLAALAGLSTGSTQGVLYVGMLKSRTISDAIIDRFDLMRVYDLEYRLKTYEALQDRVNIQIGKDDGIISVAVDDESPERAAAIANAYVEEVKKLNVQLNLSSAGRERMFLESRLEVVKNDLANAEDALKDFQEANKAIRIDDQATAIIEAVSKLKGELASKEVELGVALSYQAERSPQVENLREAISQLGSQIRKLQDAPVGHGSTGDVFLATSEMPALGTRYLRLLRNFKTQETLFELLTKQYEVAKINQARDTSPIQVIDEAWVPDRKTRPSRTLIVLMSVLAATTIAVVAAFVKEYFGHLASRDEAEWHQFREMTRLWRR